MGASGSGFRRGLPWLALLVGSVLAFGLGELALRVLRPPQLAKVRYPCVYEPDERFGYRYAPGGRGRIAAHFEFDRTVEINSLGFYDEEPSGDGPVVLAVGDSFTAAMNLPVEQVWTSVLERSLRRGGAPSADVVNLGLDGTGTDVHLEVLRAHVPRFRPQTVVLAFYANDVGDVVHGRFQRECHRGYVVSYQTREQRDALRARVDAHLEKRLRIGLYDHLYWARLLAAAWLPRLNPYHAEFVQPRLAELGPQARDGEAGARRFREAVDGLNALAERCDCRLVVAPVPPRKDARGSLALWQRYAPNSRLPLLDVLPILERERRVRGLSHEDLFFRHDRHLNALGNELYGRAVAELLSRGS
ncbi:MAG: SGNH/GDSL hydrolase family protein [Myxococcota bacterium]